MPGTSAGPGLLFLYHVTYGNPEAWSCLPEAPRRVPSLITLALRCPPANGPQLSDALPTIPLYETCLFLQPLPKESL